MNITTESSLEETIMAFIADEFFANLQYKMAKVVAKGKALNFSNKIFDDNGDEEDEHFDELVTYAQSLHIPVQINISEMQTNCTTPYVDLKDGDTTAQLASILISAEKKAIDGYETALKNQQIISEHPELTQFFGDMLNDERGHLKELEDLMSNIEANGDETPKSDIVDMNPEPQNVGNAETVVTGESVENETDSGNRTYTIKLLEQVDSGEVDSDVLAKNLMNYIAEERISDFADYNDYFDSDMARETSQYDNRECTNKFIEMIEDGMIDSKELVSNLLKFISEDEVENFSKDLGYDSDEKGEVVESVSIANDTFTFQDIFNSIISNGR